MRMTCHIPQWRACTQARGYSMSCMPSPTTWAVLPLDTTRPWSSTMPQISGISAMTLGMHGFSYGIVCGGRTVWNVHQGHIEFLTN